MRENSQSCFHLREWPNFKMLSFLEYFVFFRAVFCTEQLYMICRMDFDMFFGILIFDQKWGFCKGYSLCMMADFQNALISRIFLVFSSSFLHRPTLNDLWNGFWHIFWNFNFDKSQDFSKAIAFAWWPIFKMLSFLEHMILVIIWDDITILRDKTDICS